MTKDIVAQEQLEKYEINNRHQLDIQKLCSEKDAQLMLEKDRHLRAEERLKTEIRQLKSEVERSVYNAKCKEMAKDEEIANLEKKVNDCQRRISKMKCTL